MCSITTQISYGALWPSPSSQLDCTSKLSSSSVSSCEYLLWTVLVFFIHLFCFVFLSGFLYIPLFKNKLQLAWASISLCLIQLSYVGGSVRCPFSCLGSLAPSIPCIPFQWMEPRFSCICVKHCTTEIHPPAILAPRFFLECHG